MKKCHYIWNKEAGKVLIFNCMAVANSHRMEDCTCRNIETFEQFENQEYNKMLREKNEYIFLLEKEISGLNRQIKNILKHR